MASASRQRIIFCYDIVCPYAYIASTRIESLARRCNADVEFRPVLLGGLYKNTKAPQGKDGSATDPMPVQKRKILGKDLFTQAKRFGAPVKFPSRHPLRTLNAQRVLTAAPSAVRPALTHNLYYAYWALNEPLDDIETLQKYAARYGLDAKKIVQDAAVKATLERHTRWASDVGVFGVPAVFVNDSEEFFWGQDRLHFVERALGNANASQPRLVPRPVFQFPRKKIQFFFDFSSPWSFLGFTQLHQLQAVADVEMVPILLGALFKMIGTANLPMTTFSDVRNKYNARDMKHWQSWWGERVQWPSQFPIRTPLPLRVALQEPKTIGLLYRAAWQQNVNIGDEDVLRSLLDGSGFDASGLIQGASDAKIKDQLRANTQRAFDIGICGVPSFAVLEGESQVVVWGQDRLDLVLDLACGWRPSFASKL